MSWNVVYSARARQDLRDIYEYIAYELLLPDTASGQTMRIMKAVRFLEEMPMRYRLYKDEPWHSQGLRFLPVDNYLVFYLTSESECTVTVVRIMYSGRNIGLQLGEKNES